MKTEFTKGEWTTKITDKKSYIGDLVFSKTTGQLICDCNISNMDEKECKANAKVISHLPALLKALEDAISQIEELTETNIYTKEYKSLIKKATE